MDAELNRLSGVRRVTEATIEQLERRLAAADRWLAKTWGHGPSGHGPSPNDVPRV